MNEVRRQIDALMAQGSRRAMDAYGEEMEIVESATGKVLWRGEGIVSTISEENRLVEGGMAQDLTATARWPLDGPTPRRGLSVRLVDSGKVMDVARQMASVTDTEWRAGLV